MLVEVIVPALIVTPEPPIATVVAPGTDLVRVARVGPRCDRHIVCGQSCAGLIVNVAVKLFELETEGLLTVIALPPATLTVAPLRKFVPVSA